MSDDEITQRVRPVMNLGNRPLVEVVYRLADAIEHSGMSVADGLRDIAKTVQLAPDQISDIQRERIARVVEEHAIIVKMGAQRIREAGP